MTGDFDTFRANVMREAIRQAQQDKAERTPEGWPFPLTKDDERFLRVNRIAKE